MKQKIAFATIMGLVTTAIVSFTLILVLRGFTPGFITIWIKSWMIAYVVAIPIILVVAPKIQLLVAYLFKESEFNTTSTPED